MDKWKLYIADGEQNSKQYGIIFKR
jgi:hypothetical protein